MPQKTYDEVIIEARARQQNNISSGRQQAHGLGERQSARDIEFEVIGVAAERVIAHLLKIAWIVDTSGPQYDGDVGNDEVRSTAHLNGSLLLHKQDPSDRICWLVISGGERKYKVAGWIPIIEGKREEYWQERVQGRACHFVPQSALYSLEDYVPF